MSWGIAEKLSSKASVKAHPPLTDGGDYGPREFTGEGIAGAGRPRRIVWDGIGWDVAWNAQRQLLWVVADEALVDRHLTALTRLADCCATWSGGLDVLVAEAKKNPGIQIQPRSPTQDAVTRAEQDAARQRIVKANQEAAAALWTPKGDKDLPPGIKDKATALRALTVMVQAAYRTGATPQEVRLAVYAGMGLDSEGLDGESAAG